MSEIKSVWDGWDKQCKGKFADFTTEARCAVGYAYHSTRFVETLERVGTAIKKQYDIPRGAHPIVYANDALGLTPDDFRRIDRETQIEAAVRPLVESIEAAQPVEKREEVGA